MRTIARPMSHPKGAPARPARALAMRTIARPHGPARAGVNGYLFFLIPGVSLVFLLTLAPAAYGVAISFTNMNLAYDTWRFVGFDNYARFFTWVDLGLIMRNTAVYVGSVVLVQMVLGLLVALILTRPAPGRSLARGMAILPWVIPAVVSGLVFSQLFGGSRLGIMNYLFSLVGIRQMSWFADPALAMGVLVFVAAWRGAPFTASVLLGGLQTIPKEVYEAATIDGANGWQRFRHVTLPLLRPMVMINLIIATSAALNSLDIPLSLTGGGPGKATELLSISLYRQAFLVLDASYGATIGTVMLGMNLILIGVYLSILRSNAGAR